MKNFIPLKNLIFLSIFVFFLPLICYSQGAGNTLIFNTTDTNEYIEVPDSNFLDLTTELTIEAWIKSPGFSTNGGIVSKYWNYGSYPNMRAYDLLARGNHIEAAFSKDGTFNSGSYTWLVGTKTLSLNTWYHIAVVFKRGEYARLYINGILDVENTNPIQSIYTTNAPLRIGVDFNPSDTTRFFIGNIDEVRIWNVARSQEQIRSTMCKKLTGTETGLVAYWRLDETSGTVAYDLSGKGNNGTLTGMELPQDRVVSGASLGDQSTYVYGGSTLNLAHPDGDNLTVNITGGTADGIHIYGVGSSPNVTTPPAGWEELDPLRYWGVFIPSGTSPVYEIIYNYDGHPGIMYEDSLKLAKRDDNSSPSWTDTSATLNTTTNTLTATGQSGTEYILGSTVKQFCEDILLFANKDISKTKIVLNWSKACNFGGSYSIYRSTTAQGALRPPEYDKTTVETWEEAIPTENIVYYNILPSSNLLTLDWTGESADLCNGMPCDEDGFVSDGFSPLRGSNYIDDPYNDGISDLAISGDPAEFRVKLTCPTCSDLSDITFIDLLLDINDDGTFDALREVFPLTPMDGGDIKTGKRFNVILPSFLSVDLNGNVRWAKEDGAGILNYTFRASNGIVEASGPATGITNLTLWNNAEELIYELGFQVIIDGNCSYDTDWQEALTYFEEAESLLKPPSPYNQYILGQAKHPHYLSALMSSVIAKTSYTLRFYDTLFQSDPDKDLRDVMLDWIGFSNEQIDRINSIILNAPVPPDPTFWKIDFPRFCIFTEGGSKPFKTASIINSISGKLPFAINQSPVLNVSLKSLVEGKTNSDLRAPEPIYIFGDNSDQIAEWDTSDAYLLKAIFLSIRATATTYRIYENTSGRVVKVSDLDWIQTALEPEEDAREHLECDPEPCPPLNNLDDDSDGLIDDLGFAARVIEIFPGLGIYSPDGELNLEKVSQDTGSIIDCLREGMKAVLKEEDNQTGTGNSSDRADATLIYEHKYGIPPTFQDEWSYREGDGVSDGLPDLEYGTDDILPIGWCPDDEIQHSPPLDIQGGLGDDIEWWISQIIDFYNEYSGEVPIDEECYPQEWLYTTVVCDWGWSWQRAILPKTDPLHICFNFRDDVERFLEEYEINPEDLGPDFMDFLEFLECVEVRDFIENPEDIRNYLPFTCADAGLPPSNETENACEKAGKYTFNGFFGDWDEPIDPIVPDKFWTIEPFSVFTQDEYGINNNPACDMININTDKDCILLSWDDKNSNGEFDLFEPILMSDSSTQLRWIDLNNDGQWNGWTDKTHLKIPASYYQGPPLNLEEPDDPGKGLYNGLYLYFKDPTFGGRFPDLTNEDLNNFIGAAAGWAEGKLEFPFDNHNPQMSGPQIVSCTNPLANYCFQINATDPDGDTLHYKLIVPSLWADSHYPYVGNEVLIDGKDTGIYELKVPSGHWGLIMLVYDNVNNLNDIKGYYWEINK
ncbi:MAG: LamG domain-containing protein [Thermoanaerobaculia bacterium]